MLLEPRIRAYNRIGVYIGFFALLTGGLLLQRLSERFSRSGRPQWQFMALMGVILVAGTVDQIPYGCAPDYQGTRKRWKNDGEFVARIVALVPAGAMIFEYPYMSFPEHLPMHKMSDYEHLRGYLHSRNLRWSYGAMRGRQSDSWMHDVYTNQLEQHVEGLAFAGFSCVYVDRRG